MAKIKIEKVGMPQISDIMKASARDVEEGFTKVSEEVLPLFKDSVTKILKNFTPE